MPLNDSELDQVVDAIMVTAETMGQVLSPAAAAMMANDLSSFPLNAILAGLHATRRESGGRLVVSEVIKRIHAADGRPDANEAWAKALESFDEQVTVVWSAETSDALAAARPLLEANDKVGARMAFIAAYERLVREARKAYVPASWLVSLGRDHSHRVLVLEAAITAGRLTREVVYGDPERDTYGLLPAPETAEGRAVAGLLTGKVSEHPKSPDPRFKKMVQFLQDETEKGRARRAAAAQKAIDDFNERKRKALAALGMGVAE